MKIALIGGTGFVGAALLEELLSRGHTVTALARDPSKYTAPKEHLRVVKADALDALQVAEAVRGHDTLVSAYNPGWQEPRLHDVFLQGTRAIIDGAQRAGLRLVVVGGAGSLYVAPGVQAVDTPSFPAEWKQGALAAREALNIVKAEPGLDWTFVSPAAMLEPGPRTGRYRLGGDQMLMDGEAPAKITVADLAVAIVDELETPKHRRARFTAAN